MYNILWHDQFPPYFHTVPFPCFPPDGAAFFSVFFAATFALADPAALAPDWLARLLVVTLLCFAVSCLA